MTLAKGQSKPLNVSKTARHRVVAGLSWAPARPPDLMGKVQAMVQGKETHHDLDLACHLFNRNHEPVDIISADPAHAVDASGHIYHSGDNQEGIGEGDDEEISVELKDLPATIHTLVFTAKISSGQSFEEINNPEMRLADAYTDHNLLACTLDNVEGSGQDLFVFCCIYRDEKEKETWQIRNIGRFGRDADIGDMNAHLAALIKE